MRYILLCIMLLLVACQSTEVQDAEEALSPYYDTCEVQIYSYEHCPVLESEEDEDRYDPIARLAEYLDYMYEIDREKVLRGEQRVRRIPILTERRRLELARAAYSASVTTEAPEYYALHLLIIAGYESTFNQHALGDCVDRSQPNTCGSCGMFQVRAGDRNPGYEHRPTCEELVNDLELSMRYALYILSRFTREDGTVNVGPYNGTGNQDYVDRHNYMYEAVISWGRNAK